MIRRAILLSFAAAALLGGCTRLEMQEKATAYNEAIAEASNEQILLNVVRASQRAPMSFTGPGDVSSSPNLSGDASGTFSFNLFGLTSYSLTPTVKYGGGFSSFPIANLNSQEFMQKIRSRVDDRLVAFFITQRWPEELLDLMFIGSLRIDRARYVSLLERSDRVCASPDEPRARSICGFIHDQAAEYEQAGCHAYEVGAEILNTARDLCGMARFQMTLRRMRLLGISPLRDRYFGAVPRSPQAILYYLGELVAAQNYSSRPYTPTTYVATSEGRRLVPLFEVLQGTSADAAVQVTYGGKSYYIPRPKLGSIDEARSLQVLDFVTQVIAAQTTSKELPRVNTLGVINLQ